MKKEMACIVCPMSCRIEVEYNAVKREALDGGETVEHTGIEILTVTGNTCPRGEVYVRNELTNPVRMLTSTVKIQNGLYPRLPVILSTTIPKGKLFEVMKAINQVKVTAPIKINTIIIENVCGLGVNVIASRGMAYAEGNRNG